MHTHTYQIDPCNLGIPFARLSVRLVWVRSAILSPPSVLGLAGLERLDPWLVPNTATGAEAALSSRDVRPNRTKISVGRGAVASTHREGRRAVFRKNTNLFQRSERHGERFSLIPATP